MSQWKMIQLPRIVYATGKDFIEDKIKSQITKEWMTEFVNEFILIGKKMMSS